MFDKIEHAHLDELHVKSDPDAQLRAIIAIHSTRLGPALGGCRCIEYPDDNAALDDAIRLARGMSYKAALAGVPQGGGKAVLIKPPEIKDRAALYHAFGRFVDQLGGRYITAVDSGTQLSDMEQVARVTPYVSGTQSDGLDPSPMTALGVFSGLQAAVRCHLKQASLQGLRVAIQGVGNVGYNLAKLLHQAGAVLVVSDTDSTKTQRCVQEFNAQVVAPEHIYAQACEVFAPCGLGAVLNPHSLPQLRCAIVAGSANNQLSEDAMGVQLHQQGILYAPDYVINAGGLIQVSLGYLKIPRKAIRQRALAIGDTLTTLFERSRCDNVPPNHIADRMAEEILYDNTPRDFAPAHAHRQGARYV